jgi:hypothetical protein
MELRLQNTRLDQLSDELNAARHQYRMALAVHAVAASHAGGAVPRGAQAIRNPNTLHDVSRVLEAATANYTAALTRYTGHVIAETEAAQHDLVSPGTR